MSASTFGERFRFARIEQSRRGLHETDGAFAKAVGVGNAAVSGYRTATGAPPADRVLLIAQRCGVDPGWLAFGTDTKAPAPDAFDVWLANSRALESRDVRAALPGLRVAEGIFVPRGRDPRQVVEEHESKKKAPKKKRRAGGAR